MNDSAEHMVNILQREVVNKYDIHLYAHHHGRAWVAYEQSARNLHLLLPHISTHQRHFGNILHPLTTIVVPKLSLELLFDKVEYVSFTNDGRNLLLGLPKHMRAKISMKTR